MICHVESNDLSHIPILKHLLHQAKGFKDVFPMYTTGFIPIVDWSSYVGLQEYKRTQSNILSYARKH